MTNKEKNNQGKSEATAEVDNGVSNTVEILSIVKTKHRSFHFTIADRQGVIKELFIPEKYLAAFVTQQLLQIPSEDGLSVRSLNLTH